jgi:hypothetical protein
MRFYNNLQARGHAGTAKRSVSHARHQDLWVELWVGKMLLSSSLLPSGPASDLQDAIALKAETSRRGGAPYIREYSRLNCDGLS